MAYSENTCLARCFLSEAGGPFGGVLETVSPKCVIDAMKASQLWKIIAFDIFGTNEIDTMNVYIEF